MGLYDDILEEQPQIAPQKQMQNNTNSGLFDDILTEQTQQQTQPTFAENHPFLASTPEALKQLGQGAIHSFPEFGKLYLTDYYSASCSHKVLLRKMLKV